MTQLAAPTRAPRRVTTSRPRVTSARSGARPARPATQVATAERAGHTRFMALAVLVAMASALALLFLNTMRAEQSFTLSTLRSDVSTLNEREQALDSEISAVSAPEELTLKAESYGMVKPASITYVSRDTGKKLGVAHPSQAGTALSVNTLPSTPASKAAGEVIASGTVGLHITDPVAQAQARAKEKAAADAAAAKAEAAKKAEAVKKAEAAKKTSK